MEENKCLYEITTYLKCTFCNNLSAFLLNSIHILVIICRWHSVLMWMLLVIRTTLSWNMEMGSSRPGDILWLPSAHGWSSCWTSASTIQIKLPSSAMSQVKSLRREIGKGRREVMKFKTTLMCLNFWSGLEITMSWWKMRSAMNEHLIKLKKKDSSRMMWLQKQCSNSSWMDLKLSQSVWSWVSIFWPVTRRLRIKQEKKWMRQGVIH